MTPSGWRFLAAAVLSVFPVFAGDTSEWEFATNLGGTYLSSGGNGAETIYWGPGFSAAKQASDDIYVRGEFKHNQGRLIYDGLGGVARQSITGLTPGFSWDATEELNIDVEYSFSLGENSYIAHEGAIAAEYTPSEHWHFAADFMYNTRSYSFPDTGTAISAQSASYSIEVIPAPADWIELPLAGNISTSVYNTNSSAYNVYTGSFGVNIFPGERRWRIGAYVSPGRDSSDYTLLGGGLRIRFAATEHISLRLFTAYTGYSYTVTKSAKGKSRSSSAINPLGNSDSFSIVTAGLEATYYF